jgi:hypothetical protein
MPTPPTAFSKLPTPPCTSLSNPVTEIELSPRMRRHQTTHPENAHKKRPGYSGSTIALLGAANAKWLFHQEKATLHDNREGK